MGPVVLGLLKAVEDGLTGALTAQRRLDSEHPTWAADFDGVVCAGGVEVAVEPAGLVVYLTNVTGQRVRQVIVGWGEIDETEIKKVAR